MTTKGRAILMTGVVGVGLGGASAIQAGDHGRMGMRMGMRARGIRAALGSLDLSDAQKTQVRDLLEKQRPVMQGLREQIKADHEALRTAAADPKNLSAIGSAYLKVQKDREMVKAEMTKSREALEALLTPEQKVKLAGFRAGARGRMGRFGPPEGDPANDE